MGLTTAVRMVIPYRSLNTSLVANMVSVCAREEVTTRDMVREALPL